MKNEINNFLQNATLNERGEIYVTNRKVFCEGSISYSRHPKVFLKIPESTNTLNQIKCPYCNQIFVYKKDSHAK